MTQATYERKRLEGVNFKLGTEPGTFSAMLCQYGVKDLDNDVTVAGAFEDGAPVVIAQYGHNWEAIPVGKGVLRSDADRAYVDGSFFLNTTMGKDTYEVVKGLGDLQEWSYGFRIVEKEHGDLNGTPVRFIKKMAVKEACPVMIGANIGTHTVTIKGVKNPQKYVDGIKIAEGDSFEEIQRDLHQALRALVRTPFGGFSGWVDLIETHDDYVICSIYSYSEDSGSHVAYYRVSYTVDDDGSPVLGAPQEVELVWAFVSDGSLIKTMDEAGQAALEAVSSFKGRILEIRAIRLAEGKEGRAIASSRRTRLAEIESELRGAADDIGSILKETEPKETANDEPQAAGAKDAANPLPALFAEFQRLQLDRVARSL